VERRRRSLAWGLLAIWLIGGIIVSHWLWTTYPDESEAAPKPPGMVVATIDEGAVTLEGIVPSDVASEQAADRAAAIVGGRDAVDNQLVVDGDFGDGPWLERYLAGFAELPAAPRPLTYAVEDGRLTVTCVAASDAEKAAVLDAVSAAVEPDLTVVEDMTVEPPAAAAPKPKPSP